MTRTCSLIFMFLAWLVTSWNLPDVAANDDELFNTAGIQLSRLRLSGAAIDKMRPQSKTLEAWLAMTYDPDKREAERASRVVQAMSLGANHCNRVFDTAKELAAADQPHQRLAGIAVLRDTAVCDFTKQQECIAVISARAADPDKKVRAAALLALQSIRAYQEKNKK